MRPSSDAFRQVFLLLAESCDFTLSSAFLRFRSGLMLFTPERIQICLVDDVAEGGKLVLECALPDKLIRLQDYFPI